jgi:hypothetical protein
MYESAREAIFHSRNTGMTTKCLPTMENYTALVEACWDRRLRDDGSILFRCTEPSQDWTVIMERRPW